MTLGHTVMHLMAMASLSYSCCDIILTHKIGRFFYHYDQLYVSSQTYDEDFFGEDEEYLNALDVNHPESPYGLIQGNKSRPH